MRALVYLCRMSFIQPLARKIREGLEAKATAKSRTEAQANAKAKGKAKAKAKAKAKGKAIECSSAPKMPKIGEVAPVMVLLMGCASRWHIFR